MFTRMLRAIGSVLVRTFTARNFILLAVVLTLALGGRAVAESIRALVVWGDVLEAAESADDHYPDRDPLRVRWSFAFQETTVTVDASIDRTELEACEAISTERVFGTRLWLRAGYISNLVRQQAESRFIHSLSEEFRRIRDGLGLSSDEYLELMTRAVQAIPYGDVEAEILLPIEVVANERGVCSEKSILLASLMLHEDYDTVVWVFESQGHAAVGVASNGAQFWDSEYSFVETTRFAFIGQVSPEYRARGPINKPPEMIHVGGDVPYTAGEQVEYITSQLNEADLVRLVYNEYPRHAERASNHHKPRYAQRAAEFHDASDLTAWVMSNTYDRERVYRELQEVMAVSE